MTNVNMDLVNKAIDNIDRDRLVKLVMDLVDIPSPTGYEGDVARALNDVLNSGDCGSGGNWTCHSSRGSYNSRCRCRCSVHSRGDC